MDLQQAKDHLNKVNPLSRDAEYHIDQGFFVLEEIADGDSRHKSNATNLARTYMSRFHTTIREKLGEQHIPEPDLKSLLLAVIALEATRFASDFEMEPLRLEIASRLIDSYFQGYTERERSEAVQELMDCIEKEEGSNL